MTGGYTIWPRPSFYSLHSIYCTFILLVLISSQHTVTGASVKARRHGVDSTSGTELVGEDSQFCRYRRKILSCDFNWINKEVELPVHPNCREEVERIFVRHVHSLRLNRGSCYDLSLTHITSVKLEGENDTNCACQNFRLQNSTVQSLPSSVSNLYVHESHISNITLHNVLQQLTIIGSSIGEFNFNSSKNSALTVKLHSTTIDFISEFILSEKVSLFMQNCTLKKIQDDAFVLGSGGNILNQLRLSGRSHNDIPVITLKNGADMTMENMMGVVQIKVDNNSLYVNKKEGDTVNSEMLIMPEKQCEKSSDSNYIVAIIILVILLSISIILNIISLLYKQPLNYITEYITKSKDIENVKKNGTHKILDKENLHETEALVNKISTTERQLPNNLSAPDIIQINNNEIIPKARKRQLSLNLDETNNNNNFNVNSKDKLSPIKEQIVVPTKKDFSRRRFKSESAAKSPNDIPVTFHLSVNSSDKRLSQYSNVSFLSDDLM